MTGKKKTPARRPQASFTGEGGQVLLYQTDNGASRIEVRTDGATVWLSLNQMAELFQRDKSVISRHIRNLYEERELEATATVAKFTTVQTEGARRVGWNEHPPKDHETGPEEEWTGGGVFKHELQKNENQDDRRPAAGGTTATSGNSGGACRSRLRNQPGTDPVYRTRRPCT